MLTAGQTAGSAAFVLNADNSSTSAVPSPTDGTKRSSNDQPDWRRAKPKAAIASLRTSKASRIAPTRRSAENSRSVKRRQGISTWSGTSSSLFIHDCLPGGLVVANHAHCEGHCVIQGTTQVKTVAFPRGKIWHWPIAAG